jgi:hypothetical protein
MQEPNDHGFLLGAVAKRARRRLQRVLEAIDMVAELVALQFLERSQHVVGQLVVADFEFALEELVLLIRALIHAGETDRAFHDIPLPTMSAAHSRAFSGRLP